MKNKSLIPNIAVLLVVALVCVLTGQIYLQQQKDDVLYTENPNITGVIRLSDYNPNLKDTPGDVDIYVFDSGVPGGKALIYGGTHTNEVGSMLNAVTYLENVKCEEGTLYVDADGRKVSGWQTIDGSRYYFDEHGIRQSGTIEVNGETYVLDEDGVLQTGWSDDHDHYRDAYGKIVKNTTMEIDGMTYVFDEEGNAMDEEEARRQERAGIAEAALAQVGTAQDCTMLVTNALAANGIYYHGWPAGYLSLGTVTDDPQPGDLIYYADGGMGMAHIAVYIGNGQAVHGGYNGSETVVASAYLGSGPVFIRIG